MPLPDIPDTSWQEYQATQFKQATDAAITGLTTSYGPQLDALRARVAPENRVWVDRAIAAAQRHNVDPLIYANLIYQESGFDPKAGSNEGAKGLNQFTDPTAKMFGIDPWNGDQSVDAGARYMRQNLNATGGDYRLALASYNAGGGNVAKYGQNIFNPSYLRSQGWSEQDANQPATYVSKILGSVAPASVPQPSLRDRNLIANQFDFQGSKELTPEEAASACGPTAALSFARYTGRNPTIGEALGLAKQVGWTPSLGMAGPDSEVSLLGKMGVNSTYNPGASPDAVAKEVQAGRPVIIDTPNHYYAVDDYNPQTGQYHVGGSGLALRGGSEWMSWDQINQHGQGVRGAITVNPGQSNVGQAPTGQAQTFNQAMQPATPPGPNAAWNQKQQASFNQAVQSGPDTSAWSSVTVPPAPTVSFRDHAQAKMDALGGADAMQYPTDAGQPAGGVLPTPSPAFGTDALGPIGGGTGAGTLGRSDTFRGSPGAGSEMGGDSANGLAQSSLSDAQPPTDNANLKDFASYATSKIASLGAQDASTAPPAPFGYNDMAGANTAPTPAFGVNPQDASSPIEQARATQGATPLAAYPGLLGGNALVAQIRNNAAALDQMNTPDQPNVTGKIFGGFSPERMQAANENVGNQVFGAIGGLEAEGAPLARPLLEGVGGKISDAVKRVTGKAPKEPLIPNPPGPDGKPIYNPIVGEDANDAKGMTPAQDAYFKETRAGRTDHSNPNLTPLNTAPITQADLADAQQTIAKLNTEANRAGTLAYPKAWADNPVQHLAQMRADLRAAVDEGAPGRYWYEDSGRNILEAFGGNKPEAEKFVQLLAIYSPRAKVDANTQSALRAWSQYKAWESLGKPEQQIPLAGGQMSARDKAAADLLYGNKPWEGRKTNSFYLNLMGEIDPKRLGEILPGAEHAGVATVDTWVNRQMGHLEATKQIPIPNYVWMESELNKVRDELNANLKPGADPWTAAQVQAAMWNSVRTRGEIQVGNIKAPLPEALVEGANYHFGKFLDDSIAQGSWESAPGVTSGSMPGYHASAGAYSDPIGWKAKVDYHTAITAAKQDPTGGDSIANALGLIGGKRLEAPGYFEGNVNPGSQEMLRAAKSRQTVSGMSVPRQNQVERLTAHQLDAYQALNGMQLHQDAMPWTRAFATPDIRQANLSSIDVGRPLTVTETKALGAALEKIPGVSGPIATPRGAWVLNLFGGENKAVGDAVQRAVESVELGDGNVGQIHRFAADSHYFENNWQAAPNGESYRKQAGAFIRSPRVVDAYNAAADRVEAVQRDFAAKNGWGRVRPIPRLGLEATPLTREQLASFRPSGNTFGGSYAPDFSSPVSGAKTAASISRSPSLQSSPTIGGALVGGYAGSQAPASNDQERARNIALGAVGGGIGGHLLASGQLGRLASEDAGAIGRKAPTSSVDPMLKQAQKLVNDITNQASDALRGNDLPRYDAAQARLDQAQKVLDTLKDLRKNELMVARQKVAGPVTLPEGNPNAEIAPTPKQQATHDVVMAEQKTTGPVATAPPIPDAQATARAAVQGARLPNGQRAPIWMQAAPRALDNTAVGRVPWTAAEIASSERLIQRHQLLADNARVAGDLAQAAQYDADVARYRSQLAANRPGAPTELPSSAVDLSLPANSPLRSRPEGALPSGRVPGSLGTTSKPYSPELAGAATERALAIPQKGFAQQVEDASGRFLRESYDRLYPLRELDKQAGLGPNVGSHATAQVFSGAIAAGEDAAQRYVMPLIKQLGPDGADLEKWWLLQQSRDVLAKFKDSKLPGNIDGLGGIQREEAVIKAKLGPERFAKVQAAADQLWKLNDELRLKPLEEAGIISPQQRATLRNDNPHYLPFDRYVHSAEDPSNLLPRTSSNLSVSSSGIKARTAAGAVHALDQPMARWVSDIIQTPVVVSRNRAAKSIVDALKEAEKVTGQKLIVEAPEATAQAAKLGQMTVDRGSISYFDPAKPGVRMVANVPAIYATVAKGMEAETSNVLSRVAGALAAPLRVGATALDPTFTVVNATRDLQTAYFREGLTATSPHYIAGLKAALAKNTDFEAAAKAGVLHSGLMETRKTTDAIKRAQQLRGIQVNNIQDAMLLVPRLMALAPQQVLKANEVIEQAPRIGVYMKLRAEGFSELESAVRARDATVDFDKSGNQMRVLNQAVPFLNARTQGGVNVVRMFKDNPKQAALRAAPLIVPEVLFWLWNQRYASSKLIPPYEYDRSYIVQVGESTENQDPKNPNVPKQAIPIYLKIPKGDPSAVITAPVTAMLQAAFQQGDRSAVELVLHAAQAATQGLSPIDPNVNSALSTLTPPLMATTQQIAQNRNTFTGRDIVPQGELGRPASQQYDATTSRTAVALGEQFHVSPRLIDFAIRNYAGGTGHNAEWLSDLALGALGYNPQAPGQAMKQQLTPVQQAATMPGVSRFLGAKNSAEQIQSYQSLQDAVSQTRDLLYQNPEVRRFGIGIQPVNSYITYDGRQVPLTPDEQVQYQQLLGQQMKKDLDALPARQAYQQYKTDALKRRAVQLVMDHSRQIVENQMLHDIGPQISQRLKVAS